MSFKFEKLEIWQIGIQIADEVNRLTKKFPKDEIFVLTSQMKRAADSISLNISEGSTGQSNAEQLRFLGYAQRSALEVVNCLYLSQNRGYIEPEEFSRLYDLLEKEVAKIQAFKNSINQ